MCRTTRVFCGHHRQGFSRAGGVMKCVTDASLSQTTMSYMTKLRIHLCGVDGRSTDGDMFSNTSRMINGHPSRSLLRDGILCSRTGHTGRFPKEKPFEVCSLFLSQIRSLPSKSVCYLRTEFARISCVTWKAA